MKEMNKVPLDVANHPVGLDEAVQDFESTIALDHQSAGSTKTRTVGIWGMGGSGKTTLAKEIFNRRHSSMHWSSFLSDIRDAHTKDKLLDKQKTLLEDLDAKDDRRSDNLDKGKQILKNRLSRSVPVLIVLDDVDDINQLDYLLPPKESLGDQTLIIVTTRDKNVLQQLGVSDSAIYQMKLLDPIHAKQLFCSYAFSGNSPPPEVEDLVEKFLKACDGLPLSLKVLGGQLCGKSGKDYWEDTWNKYSQIPHTDIKKRLKVSYDALEKEEQEMFLDAACLFIGQRKSAAIAAWDAAIAPTAAWDAKFYGRLGWDTLLKKCLVEEVEVREEVLIRMHDHLRDLGRDIANEQPAHRLWSPHQVIKITSQQESLRVRGIAEAVGDICYHRQGKIVIKARNQEECSLPPSSLEGLKFFAGNGEFFSQELSNLSKELIWLKCDYIGQSTHIPPCPALKKLRILEVSDSRTLGGLWADVPSELRELVISCQKFAGFPRCIDHAKYLKRIVIHNFDGSQDDALKSDLPKEFCNLISLEHLELTGLRNLSSLPSNFGKLTKLRHLNLSYCTNLEALPDSFKKLTLLEYLSLQSCLELSMKSELNVLENMTKLRYLNLEGCKRLQDIRLPESDSLTDLHLLRTGLKELPANIFHLSKLTKLEIGSQSLTTFPICEGNLCALTTLTISGCKMLKSLPDSLEHLSLLKDLTLQDTGVKCLPLKSLIHLQRLTIEQTPLSELSLRSCCMLKRIRLQETKVAQISIGGDSCPALETLELCLNDDLRELEILPEKLKTLDIEYCKSLKDIKGVRGLKELKSMKIRGSKDLEELPCFAELTSLQEIDLRMCPKLKKIEGLGNMRSLKTLNTSGCLEVEKIEGLEQLSYLRKLKVHTRWEAPCMVSLANSVRLRSLEVVANNISAVEPFVSNIQKCTREVIICTKAVRDVGFLKSFFQSFPNVSVLDYYLSEVDYWESLERHFSYVEDVDLSDESEDEYSDPADFESQFGNPLEGECLELRAPRSSAKAKAILKCFIIETHHSDLRFSVQVEGGTHYAKFNTELGEGKWVWMGVFTKRQRCYYWGRDTDYIFARDREGNNVKVRVEAAWLVMGEEGSIVEAFRQHFQRWSRNDVSSMQEVRRNDVSSTQELEVSPCNMWSGRTIVTRHENGPVCESKKKAFHTIRKIICCAGGASKENDVTLIKKL